VGVPFETLPAGSSAGVIHVLRGVHGVGLTTQGAQTVHQMGDPSEYSDRFGAALAAGRFSGHSGADLAVGAPYESDPLDPTVGAVDVFFSDALFVDGFESGDLLPWSSEIGAL